MITKKIEINLKDMIYNYPTKSEYGFNKKELELLLTWFPTINMKKFNDAMIGNTCMVDEVEGIITYHIDVLTALRCGLENRDIKFSEFD